MRRVKLGTFLKSVARANTKPALSQGNALTPPPIRARMERMALHFVRFPDNHGRQFQNAVRVFGPPDFLHRLWDRRARLEG